MCVESGATEGILVCLDAISSDLSACKSRGGFSVLSNSKTFAPFLCDHCNVNETARQYGSVFMFAFNIGMMDKSIPNRKCTE